MEEQISLERGPVGVFGLEMEEKVVIFEDECITALHLRTLLSGLGYVVVAVKDSTDKAAEIISSNPPDVVLMDIHAEGEMDAIETAELIHDQFGIPVVFLSAHNDDSTRRRIEASRAYGLVVKPFNEDDVYVAIKSTLHRRRIEQALAPETDVVAPMLSDLGDGVMATDAEGRIIYMSESAEKLTGWHEIEAFGHPATDVLHLNEAKDGSLVVHPVSSVLKTRKETGRSSESIMTSRSGEQRPTSHHVRSVRDPHGELLGAVVSIRRRREFQDGELSAADAISFDAEAEMVTTDLLVDFLGNVINRARSRQAMAAVFNLTIDGCETVDGTSGSGPVEELLGAAATRLQNCLRASDAVVQTNPNTLVIIQPDLEHAAGAVVLGKKLTQIFERPFVIGEIEVTVAATVGAALFPVDGEDPRRLLGQAERKPASDTESGSFQIDFFSKKVESAIIDEENLREDLDRAIIENQLVIQYQPLFDLSSRTIIGAEAQLQWRHPERGLIPTQVFAPIAERNGVSVSITDWAIREALTRASSWFSIAPGIRISIPLTGSEIKRRTLVPHIIELLNDTGIESHALELELREDQLVTRPAMTTHLNLHRLSQLGVNLTIEDFGFEFASLVTLKKTPVHKIKLDSSLVALVEHEKEAQAIVKTTIDLARNWGLEVAADGVDDEAQWRWLRYHGCEIGQGEFLAGFLSGQELFERLVEQHH